MNRSLTKCRKRSFRNELDAKIALASTQRAKGSNREECRVYYHPVCRKWHLTHLRKEMT